MVEAWADELRHIDVELHVYYTDEGDQQRGWSTRAALGITETRLRTLINIPKYGKLNAGLQHVISGNDILIIGGLEQASYLWSAILAKINGKKTILLFDGFSPLRFNRERLIVRLLKRLTAKLCTAFFANGTVGRRYLETVHHVARARIFNEYLSVDTEAIASRRAKNGSQRELRERLNLPLDSIILIFCGYLIERKRLDLVISALATLPEAHRPILLAVGTGPLLNDLRSHALSLRVPAVFAGFHEGAKLADYYLSSDMLVLPSDDEPWGLVINEAMAAGLGILCSDACGAADDLVREGVNGYVFRTGDESHLRQRISLMLEADLSAFGQASLAIINEWTPSHSAQSLLKCLAFVRSTPQ
jgi:glycosyltransferase involved in cell wall biosynthesis